MDIQNTFDFLHHSASEMALGKLERTGDYMERTKYTDNIQMARKSNLRAERGLELQLSSIPGVSAKMARAVCGAYPCMMDLCRAYGQLKTEKEKQNLLSDLTFRGPSGKEQRLATRSSKIYHYICGIDYVEPSKAKKAKKTK